MNYLDEYDRNKLKDVRKILVEVYEYNYGISPICQRIETILNKVDYLISLGQNERGKEQ